MAKVFKSQCRLNFTADCPEIAQQTEAELKMAVLTAASNIPLAFHDVLSPTIRDSFPDSKIASRYHSASTKATCMLNRAVAPMLVSDLLETMKVHPFSLSVDGSNDSGLEKMNPVDYQSFR